MQSSEDLKIVWVWKRGHGSGVREQQDLDDVDPQALQRAENHGRDKQRLVDERSRWRVLVLASRLVVVAEYLHRCRSHLVCAF